MNEIPRDARFIEDDLVSCPLRHGSTDVEACWRCPWLRGADVTDKPRFLRCKPPFAGLPPVGVGPSSSSAA
jgi:hypothetical protein